MIAFRNFNDKLHFFGSFYLTQTFSIFYFFLLNHEQLILIYFLSLLSTNVLGWIYEFLEWKVLIHWRNPIWKKLPKWMIYLSGDHIWDWQDVKLNFLGSTLVVPTIYFIGNLLNKKKG